MTAAVIHSQKFEATDVNSTHTTGSFTVPAGANKRLVVVLLTARGAGNTPARTVTSVVWNGNSLTSRVQSASAVGTGVRVAIFDFALGSTTGTSTIVLTWSGTSTGCIVHAFVLEDVEQGTPTPTAVSSTNLSDAITLSAAGIAIDGLANASNNTASNFSLTGATQTQTSLSPSRTGAGTTNEQNLGTSAVVGSGSQTFTWTATNSPNKAHAIAGYLQVSSGSTPAPTAISISGTSSVTIAAKAAARTALSAAGSSAVSIAARASARTALSAAAAATLSIAAVAGARAAVSISGDSTLTLATRAAAVASLSISGTSTASIAARATAVTSIAIAGTSVLTIGTGDNDLTATPGRTFVSAGRERTYSENGRRRIFVLDTRQRTF